MLGLLLRHCLGKCPRSLTFRALASPSLSVNTGLSKVWNHLDSGRTLSSVTTAGEHHGQNTDAETLNRSWKDVILATDPETEQIIAEGMLIHEDFITEKEEDALFNEVEPYLKRLRYEYSHWDDAIHGYRETERKNWKQENKAIIQRMKDLAFSPDDVILPYVHVLDLEKTGCIKAHVDSVRFCGTTLCGISLLSSAIMRLVCEKDKSRYADVYLKRRSMYIMRGRARYEYTHEVLPEDKSTFRGQVVPRERRISVICRNEPLDDVEENS